MGISEDIISALEEVVDTIQGSIMHPLKQLQGEEEYEKGVEEWRKLCATKSRRK